MTVAGSLALPVPSRRVCAAFPVPSPQEGAGVLHPLFLYAFKDSKPGPICAGLLSWGAGFPRVVPPSKEGEGSLHPPLFLYAFKETRSGLGVADVGAGSGVVNGVSGACPLRGGARIPTSARPRALVLLDTYTLLVTRRAGRWLRKMRCGRQLVLPIGARRVIARPAVSRSGAGCPCWGLGQSPF